MNNILKFTAVLFLLAGCFAFGADTAKLEPVKLREGFQFGTNLWSIAWGGDAAFKNEAAPGEYSDKRYAFTIDWANAYDMEANKPLVDVWNPVFLEGLKPYTFIRFIDWGAVDIREVMEKTNHWSDRKLPTENHTGHGAGIIAYEWMIDLCNRLDKDAWICVPHQADDEYIEELAKLFHKTLKPELKLYIEYSNETWNYVFAQHMWCYERGKEIGFTGEGLPGGLDISEGYTITRSFRIFSIFEKVYGKEEMAKRVVRTSCTFVWAADRFNKQYTLVKESERWNPDGQKSDFLCIAPYVGAVLDGADPDVVEKFRNDMENGVYPLIVRMKAVAEKHGLKFGCYEAGQHITKNAYKFSENPAIYDCYIEMFNKFCPEFDLVAHLNNCGGWADGGAWGAMRYTGQPLSEAHKYRAIVDWVKANVKND